MKSCNKSANHENVMNFATKLHNCSNWPNLEILVTNLDNANESPNCKIFNHLSNSRSNSWVQQHCIGGVGFSFFSRPFNTCPPFILAQVTDGSSFKGWRGAAVLSALSLQIKITENNLCHSFECHMNKLSIEAITRCVNI